jgi:alginate O-acetyltransferase complex protein AlgI
MTFNSLPLVAFVVLVYASYRLLPGRYRNILLLAASYAFYASFDWRFLGLLLLSTSTDFYCARRIAALDAKDARRRFLAVSLVVNLGVLGVFKYFNFFLASAEDLLRLVGLHPTAVALRLVLPVGISFYTFKTISYTVDVYRKRLKPSTRFSEYALFVAFFPTLVAGPIDRAGSLLKQIQSPRDARWTDVPEAFALFCWGLFKKVFVADNLLAVSNAVFSNPGPHTGPAVVAALYAYAFQVYCDFSGYSDMARGIARLFGYEVMNNFERPLFATSLQDLWNRWHISLTSWIRDYIYYPLALTKVFGRRLDVRVLTIVTFVIMGLWHGAAWNFIAWGAYQGSLLSLAIMLRPWVNRATGGWTPRMSRWRTALKPILLFQLFALGCLFFRAQSMAQVVSLALDLTRGYSQLVPALPTIARVLLIFLPVLVFEHLQGQRQKDATFVLGYPRVLRYAMFSAGLYLVAIHGAKTETFVYFQF